jgi:hypothetical protein
MATLEMRSGCRSSSSSTHARRQRVMHYCVFRPTGGAPNESADRLYNGDNVITGPTIRTHRSVYVQRKRARAETKSGQMAKRVSASPHSFWTSTKQKPACRHRRRHRCSGDPPGRHHGKSTLPFKARMYAYLYRRSFLFFLYVALSVLPTDLDVVINSRMPGQRASNNGGDDGPVGGGPARRWHGAGRMGPPPGGRAGTDASAGPPVVLFLLVVVVSGVERCDWWPLSQPLLLHLSIPSVRPSVSSAPLTQRGPVGHTAVGRAVSSLTTPSHSVARRFTRFNQKRKNPSRRPTAPSPAVEKLYSAGWRHATTSRAKAIQAYTGRLPRPLGRPVGRSVGVGNGVLQRRTAPGDSVR